MDDELRELVKGYLGHLETTGIFPPAKIPIDPAAADSAVAWMKALRWCPRELLDLLNSKACRGGRDFLVRFQVESDRGFPRGHHVQRCFVYATVQGAGREAFADGAPIPMCTW